MSKLQPSPDWFVGLDSIDLCGSGGHFVDTLTVEADPLDAGTDNGFTFTSPNWPTGVLTNAIYHLIIYIRRSEGGKPQFSETKTSALLPTYNQGLHKLFLSVSRDLGDQCATPVSLYFWKLRTHQCRGHLRGAVSAKKALIRPETRELLG